MSVSKWAYEPEKCDGQPCIGDCDLCNRKEKVMEYKELVQMIDDIYSREDAEGVYAELDKALAEEKISWWEHDTLQNITYKIAKNAW